MGVIDRVASRVAYERRRRTIRNFHRLYYDSPWQTWKNTRWLSVNAYKTPLDLWIYQELVVALKPQLVIETGTNMGGSALFLATVCDAIGYGEIVSIDSESRAGRPAHDRVTYLIGSSVAPETLDAVALCARGKEPVMVILDSDHSREHVLAELRHYAGFVTPGSYLIVEDTNLNGHPVVPNFGPGPMEAVQDFLGERDDFKTDSEQEKFMLSFQPGGYLRRVPSRVAPEKPRPPAGRTRPSRSRKKVASRDLVLSFAALLALVIFVFVALPEMFGDHPYDPEPSAWPSVAHHM